jgi:hypothetical protein
MNPYTDLTYNVTADNLNFHFANESRLIIVDQK